MDWRIDAIGGYMLGVDIFVSKLRSACFGFIIFIFWILIDIKLVFIKQITQFISSFQQIRFALHDEMVKNMMNHK